MMLGKGTGKRFLSLILVTVMSLSLALTGCASDQGDVSGTPTQEPTDAKTTQEPTQEPPAEPGVINILTVGDTDVADKEVYKIIEERLNIIINWELLPNAGYEDALNIKLSAGDQMPEIFASWLQTPEMLAQNGAIIALNDYFDTTMQNTKRAIEEDPVLSVSLQSPDGNTYYLPKLGSTPTMGWQIRKDWLDKLNLEIPETTDDLLDVLKAFRDADLNETGQNDIVPMALRFLDYTWLYLMQSWGLTILEPWNWVGVNDSGELNIFLLEPEFKDVIAYINELYTNKLLNQDLLTVSTDSYDRLIGQNRVGLIFDGIGSKIGILEDANPDLEFEWITMLPAEGPNGHRGVRTLSGLDAWTYVSSNGNTEDATRFLDYIFGDPEGHALMHYGVEGVHYEVNANGEIVLTDLVMNNPDKTPGEIRSEFGNRVGNIAMRSNEVIVQLDELQNIEYPEVNEGNALYRDNNMWDNPEPKYRFTNEESEKIVEIKNRCETYVKENLAKMIVGEQSMDTWDDFVEALKGLGIEEMADIYKAVEERVK